MARKRTYYESKALHYEKERKARLVAETEGMDDCGRASHGRFVQGCRCRACRAANAAYERGRTRRKAREAFGEPSMWVDAAPVRAMLLRLYAQGYTRKEIERLCGVGHTQQYQIVHRHWRTGKPVRRVLRKTKDALMNVRGRRSFSECQKVDGEWVAGWLREYRRLGMSAAEMSRTIGVDRQTVDALLHGKRKRIRASTLLKFAKAKPVLDRKAGR